MKKWKFRELKWLTQGYVGSKWRARIWTQTFEARHSGLSLRLRVTACAGDYSSIFLDSKRQELLCLLWGVYFYRSLFEYRIDYILSSGLTLPNLLAFQEKLNIQIFMDTMPIFECWQLCSFGSLFPTLHSFLIVELHIHTLPNRTNRGYITHLIGFGFGHVIWVAQWNVGKCKLYL